MAKFPINNNPEEKRLFRDEWEAHEENRKRDILNSIRNRTMTKESYLKVVHGLREFCRNLKQNIFVADLF